MPQDERDAGNEETDFRIKKLLSWQNVLSNRQVQQIQKKNEPIKNEAICILNSDSQIKLNSLLRELVSYKVLKTS